MGILEIILLILIVFFLIVLSWIWPPNSPWAPWWRTKIKTAESAFEMAKVNKNDMVFELGSGEATALIVASKKFGAKGVGIEIDPARYFLSKLTIRRKNLHKEIEIKRGDLFKEDLSSATVVYVYLVPKTLKKLLPKIKKELKKGTRIVSYKYEIDLTLKQYDEKNELRLYII
jgi:tRNA A58 N-methylase Trm61